MNENRERRQSVSFYITDRLRLAIKRIAKSRGTSESATSQWLLARAVEWYDNLPKDERESA